MMDWSRKHLVDLSGLCKDCEQDPALQLNQRQAFSEAYQLTKQFSSLPHGGGAKNVAAVIAHLCGACQAAFTPDCAGRSDWQQSCPLVKQRVYQQMR